MGDRRVKLKSIPPAHGRAIDGLSPEMSAAEAIERSIGGRLRAVEELLPVAIEKAEFDVRAVHRLRVATRRAAAAIRAFKDTLPRKSRKRALATLKSIRAAASVARASDVDLAALRDATETSPAEHQPAIAFVMGVVAEERAAAATALIAHCSGDVGKAIRKSTVRLCEEGARSKAAATAFLTVAERAVEAQFDKAVAASLADLRAVDDLHQLRIECKRLRYTLEAVGPCAEQLGAAPLYDVLVESQDQFGAVNDAHELADRINAAFRRFSSAPYELPTRVLQSLEQWSHAQSQRAEAAHHAFLQWWDDSALKAALAERRLALDSRQSDERAPAPSSHSHEPEETHS